MTDPWTYRADVTTDGSDVVGYDVEASDGDIGKIDETTDDAGRRHVVVDTGFWIFGKKRLIPAGAIERIDHDDKKVFVAMTKEQIKDAPEFDESKREDDTFRSQHEEYYRPYTG